MSALASKKKQRLAVIHWFPVEQYPPALNLLTYFADLPEWEVLAFSTCNERDSGRYAHPALTLNRGHFPGRQLSRLVRAWRFLVFPALVFFRLLRFRPQVLLYIEPHSSLPAVLYCLISRLCQLFIHNHEYHEPQEFLQPGMRLVRWYHALEQISLFQRAVWISQTNADRVRMFCDDHPHVKRSKLHVLPNLPPASWPTTTELTWNVHSQDTLKLLYVGSVSLHDTFIGELVEWLRRQPDGQVSLDVYSTNCDAAAEDFLNRSAGPNLRFHAQGIPYEKLPDVLPQYHVGLILYRGNTRNYIYNESNKLFEYLACGLDVWFPRQMLGIKPHARSDVAPRVIEMDFERLDEMQVAQLRSRSGLRFEPFSRRCEDVLSELREAMTEAVGSRQ